MLKKDRGIELEQTIEQRIRQDKVRDAWQEMRWIRMMRDGRFM